MVSPEIPWVFLGEWNLPELPPTEDRNNHQDVAAAAAAALAARGEAAAGLLANRFLSAHAFMVMKVVAGGDGGWDDMGCGGNVVGHSLIYDIYGGFPEIGLPSNHSF